MTNLEALSAKCNRICSAFYADRAVLTDSLNDANLQPDEPAKPNDRDIIRQAIILVRGFVETGRSENGVSVSVDREAVKNNILFWCNQAGLDASEFVEVRTIKDASNRW